MSLTSVYLCWIIRPVIDDLENFALLKIFLWHFEDDEFDLSSVAVTDLQKSLEKFFQGSTLPPYSYDFAERFVQQRDLHFFFFAYFNVRLHVNFF